MGELDVDELIARRLRSTPLFGGSKPDRLTGDRVRAPELPPGVDVDPDSLSRGREPGTRARASDGSVRPGMREPRGELASAAEGEPGGERPMLPRRRVVDWVRGVLEARDEDEREDGPSARYPNAGAPWSPEDEIMVLGRYLAGESVHALAEALGRKPSAVQRRVEQVALRVLEKQYRARS